MPRSLRYALGLLLGGLLTGWFLRGVEPAAVGRAISLVRVDALAAAVGLSLSGQLVRAWRWRYLVAPIKWVRPGSAIVAVFAGWTVSAIAPGRLGELARALLLARRERLGKGEVFGTIVLERLLDVVAVLGLLAAYLTFFPFVAAPGPVSAGLLMAMRTGGWLALSAVTLAVLGAVTVGRLPTRVRERVRRRVQAVFGVWGRRGLQLARSAGEGAVTAMAASLPDRSRARLRTLIVAHTLLVWAVVCGTHSMLFQAFGIAAPAVGVAPVIVMITLGIVVPVPAAIGSYHTAAQLALTVLLGVPEPIAAAYAIVSHAVAYVPSVAIGLTLLVREGYSWSQVSQVDG